MSGANYRRLDENKRILRLRKKKTRVRKLRQRESFKDERPDCFFPSGYLSNNAAIYPDNIAEISRLAKLNASRLLLK